MNNHFDPTDLVGQAQARSEAELKRRHAAKDEEDELKWVMSSKHGRRFVWRLLSSAGVYRSSFSTNAMQMAFNEGARDYGNRLLERLNLLVPEMYDKMQNEARNGRPDDGTGNQSN